MTRDAEHTPTGYEDAASVVVNQAPAPSSLAGGKVKHGDVIGARLRVTAVASAEVLAKAYHPSTFSDPVSAFWSDIAALSPEAPARDGEAAHWLTDLLGDDQNGGFIRDLCYTVWQAGRYGYNGGPGDWANDTLPTVQRGVEMVSAKVEGLLALTPRHEAPADDGPVFHMNLLSHEDNEAWLESARRVAAKHEAPAEGAGVFARQMEILRKAASVPVPDDDSDFTVEKARRGSESWRVIAANVLREYDRARSSAPEAREGEAARDFVLVPREPTGAMLKAAFVAMNDTPSGTWKKMKVEARHPIQIFNAKMRPRWAAMISAAPNADKLWIAVEALERIAHESRPVTRTAMREHAAEALAALKAEGAK